MSYTDRTNDFEQRALRDRILDYAAIFATGLGIAASIGFLVGVLTNADVLAAIGAAILFLGVLSLLSAGLSGGRYAAYGVGQGTARYNFVRDSFSFASSNDRSADSKDDPLFGELSHGYRAEKDPVAFWLAIGGVLYVAIGFIILAANS